jgi:hypothetical protein
LDVMLFVHQRSTLASLQLFAFAVASVFLVQLGRTQTLPQTGNNIRTVNSIVLLQRAIKDGVRHVVLTDHIIATMAQTEVEGKGESLDTSVATVTTSTKSIVVSSFVLALLAERVMRVNGRLDCRETAQHDRARLG